MKTFLLSAALSLAAVGAASAQMAPPPPAPGMAPMAMMQPGMAAGPQSCVRDGMFVPCPPPGAMMGGDPAMERPMRRMSQREMRRQRMMEQGM